MKINDNPEIGIFKVNNNIYLIVTERNRYIISVQYGTLYIEKVTNDDQYRHIATIYDDDMIFAINAIIAYENQIITFDFRNNLISKKKDGDTK